MPDLATLSLKAVTTHYLFANTPVYLYRRLRAEESVKALADSATPLELAALVAKMDRKRKRGPEDIAVAYSAIVAATFHSSREVHEAFDQLNLRHLDWANAILGFWYETLVSTDTRVVTLSAREITPTAVSATPTSRLIVLPGGHE